MSPNITSKIAGLDDSFTILPPRLQRSFTRSYLMKSNIRHPVVVLLVRGYSVRQVEAAAGDKVRESHPLIAWFLGLDSNKSKPYIDYALQEKESTWLLTCFGQRP